MNNLLLPLRDLWHLIYPSICISCCLDKPLNEDIFCLSCSLELPFTDHHQIHENEMFKKFVGRAKIESASALSYFSKSGIVQKAIHELKYKNNSHVGSYFGKLMGERLKSKFDKNVPDVIVPVPLHYKKKHIRGYNQTIILSKAIETILNIPIEDKVLEKKKHSVSQTTKSRADRFKNVLDSFDLKNKESLIGKHILVVDDVFTTGATLEACIVKLNEISNVKISVAVIAMAQ